MNVRSLVGSVLVFAWISSEIGAAFAAAEAAETPATPKVAAFVTAQMRDGLANVDHGIRDSIKDIQSEVRRSKEFTLAQEAEDAVVIITVIGRNTPGNSHRVPFPVGPGMSMMMPVRRRAIDIILRVGSVQREMTSEPEGDDRWKAAAKQLVKDVAAFVDANRAALGTP
ncbi:MAG: hypothetical protein ABIR28_00360 [Vicinamibacteria bacterium]